MSGLCARHVCTKQDMYKTLQLLHPRVAWFLCGESDYVWDSAGPMNIFIWVDGTDYSRSVPLLNELPA